MNLKYHKMLYIREHTQLYVNRCCFCGNCAQPYEAGGCSYAEDGMDVEACEHYSEISEAACEERINLLLTAARSGQEAEA